jgi:hypothetical protein
MPSIFLSHNHQDKLFVRELASYLRNYGIQVWVDEVEMKIGDSLTEKVGSAIKENAFFGVVLSKNSINSTWVERELQIALQREFREKRVVVLPIMLDSVELPPFLSDKLYADFSTPDKFYSELGKLVSTLGAQQKPGPRVYISYTHDSYDHKNWVADLLQRLLFDGVNATFDYSFMQPGTDFWEAIFLELSRAHSVLLICTPAYKSKAEGLIPGGLKREFDAIIKQTTSRHDLKVIPVVRNGNWSTSIPQQFASRFGLDMTRYPPNEDAYMQLLKMLK